MVEMTGETTDETSDENGWTAARRDLRRAYLLISFGHLEPAIEACRRADRRLDGEHHLPKTMEGNVEMARGDVREALGTLRQVTRAHPDAALPRVHFAEACLLAGRKRQGQRALQKARELDDGQHQEFIEQLEAAWEGVEPDEVPPPVEIAETPATPVGGRDDDGQRL